MRAFQPFLIYNREGSEKRLKEKRKEEIILSVGVSPTEIVLTNYPFRFRKHVTIFGW